MRTSAVEPFVTFDRGASTSLPAIVCKASIVADGGGVFSPNILCGCLLREGRTLIMSRVGVSRPGVGVVDLGVSSFSGDFSGDTPSKKKSLLPCGVEGRFEDFSGELGDDNAEPLSKKLLRSRTLPVCKDCMRLWAAPLIRERSGEGSIRFGGGFVMYALSLAFSVNAACADLMALEV